MPEQLQQVFEVIKDYGAAMISTIAAGGLAGIASIIKSIKNSVNANKDEVKNLVNNEAKSTKEIKEQLLVSSRENAELKAKIDDLIDEINKIKKEWGKLLWKTQKTYIQFN